MRPPAPASGQTKFQLAMEGLALNGAIRFRAGGVSMLPTLLPGDLLEIERTAPAEFRVGDIVLFSRGESLFVHRLIAIDETRARFTTRGDSMGPCDPEQDRTFLGRVISVERGGRRCAIPRRLGHLTRFAGWLMYHSALLRSLCLRWQAEGSEGQGELLAVSD
jgi:peptidase S24-like protein